MQRAFDFLNTHRDLALATVENGKPRLRVFQIMLMDGHTLWFATNPKKEVWAQLQAEPEVEMLAMDGNISVRMRGTARFDVPDDICRRVYEGSAILQRLYSDYKAMAYFSVAIEKMDYYDLTPTPPVLESWVFEN